jgi:hypothetical protein
MKTGTFWTSVIIVTLIIFGGIAVISNGPEKPKESGVEGYIDMEPMEIIVPVTVFDFTDEPPMLITPDMVVD